MTGYYWPDALFTPIKAARKANKDKRVDRRLKALELQASWMAQSNAKKETSKENKR